MNSKLPYEEKLKEQLEGLPLPDEDQSWQLMKEKLEEKDKDWFIPPFFFTGCLGGMLLLLLFTGVWFVMKKAKKTEATKKEIVRQSPLNNQKQTAQKSVPFHSKGRLQTIVTDSLKLGKVNVKKAKWNQNSSNKTGLVSRQNNTTNKTYTEEKKIQKLVKQKNQKSTNKTKQNSKENSTRYVLQKRSKPYVEKQQAGKIYSSQTPIDSLNNQPQLAAKDSSKTNSESTSESLSSNPTMDSSIVENTKPKSPEPNSTVTAKNQPPKKWSIGAGIALQKQLPVDSQRATPYSYLGRKASLSDYIPSVYVRLYNRKRWFLQAEFRYGAPQYTREFVYHQKSVYDSSFTRVQTTSYRLKKTFYHQLPLSIHYFVKQNWSIGGGILFEKFYRAVSEEEVRQRTLFSDTVLSKKIITDSAGLDTLFTKFNFQLFLETQYKWKRFSVGARYTQGLQPYIRYVDPVGTQKSQRNNSIQLFIRYEILKPKSDKHN